ncbi:DNA alkylation repair protein [Nocardia donostiensis]|uniref:DNA alkylation repair protein n=1 Tax=Nocardia donostiensis TaxID=1538463 RepID=A0A1V2TCL1_9NOCA|nr:DNA alkylation repair protein [Nocardia donostiensis]ONM47198.1 DNA alkylation repair protein [Nocardia donostiensis]OQS15304.1 DNA alkylation repair protein [Nocardia donostiensis]OQS20177.1 DNA alkylation repair protein [Nocardia donostiensis]
MTAGQVRKALAEYANPDDAANLQRFFKTGPGEYGEGDVFIGVRVPVTRSVAKRFSTLSLVEIDELLNDPVHEHRMAALVILGNLFTRVSTPRAYDAAARDEIAARYLAAVRRGCVNNWDLVDVSAEKIIGPWLFGKPIDLLMELAAADSLWERRVALLATFAFIKSGDPAPTFTVAEHLLDDRRDLIQKALGWMLREVGKRIDQRLLTDFLNHHAPGLGRTALSYATEHLTPEQRARYRALR